MLKRTITGILLAALVLSCIWLQGYFVVVPLTIAMLIGLHEMMDCLKKAGKHPIERVSYLFVLANGAAQAMVLHMGGSMSESLAALQIVTSLCAVVGFAAVVARGKVDMDRAFSTIIPMIYPGAFFALIYPLNLLGGRMMTMIGLALCFFVPNMNDLFAMLVGMKFGKHKLSPMLSPKKTVEGSVAGIIAAVAFAALIPFLFAGVMQLIPAARAFVQPLPEWWKFALMGIPCGAAAQFGDLAASMVKRQCGVKDFGSIFPGHGGVMDRVDGVFFAAPVVIAFYMIMGV